ncbi:MAG: hypothetical protein Q8N76_02890 [Candidatus Omnitrophota bacterium]|nr:hypothetical protein [Candidatus Omnitrophota bacterium]
MAGGAVNRALWSPGSISFVVERRIQYKFFRNRKKITMSKELKTYKNLPKKVYIRTFGWPLVTVARDGIRDSKEDKCFGIKGLG